MLNESFLKDNFFLQGDSLDKFKTAVKEITALTVNEKITTSDLKLLSYRPAKSNNDDLVFWTLDAGSPWKDKDEGTLLSGRLNKQKILNRGNFQPLIDEMVSGIQLMLIKDNKAYFVSRGALETMGARAGLKGDMLYDNCIERNLCLAKGLGKAIKENATLILCSYNGCRKVMAMFSEKYAYVPQTCLVDILEQLQISPLGNYVCKKWNISHEITQIWIEFPEKAEELRKIYKLKDELVPGLYLAASNTGNSSLKAIGTWRIGASISYDTLGFGEDSEGTHGSRKHSGQVDAQAFCEKVDKEVFSQQTKLPEALCNLMLLDITDPSWDLNTNKGQKANRTAVTTAIKGCFAQIGMVAAVGKTQELAILDLLCQEINPTVAYTAYDIAMMVMSLAGRISGLSKAAEKQLAFVIAKAPYCKFGKPVAPALVLTA